MLISVYLNIPLIEVNLNLLSGCTAISIRMQMPIKNDSRRVYVTLPRPDQRGHPRIKE